MRRRPQRCWPLLLLAAGALAVAGCADQDVVVVEIRGNTFDPGTVEVTPGTTVRWINHDARPHAIRPADDDDPTWEGAEITSGERVSHTFDEPTTWAYQCAFHGDGEMIGVVVVDPDAEGGV